jgi:hypothetical protein
MANQKPDAGHFADVGFLIFGALAPVAELSGNGKRMAQLSPYLTGK